MSDLDDLRSRRASIEGVTDAAASASRSGNTLKIAAFAGILLAIAVGAYLIISALERPTNVEPSIPTSETTQFPEDRDAGDTLALPEVPAPVVIERPVIQTVPDSAALARLEELEAELAQAREAIAASEGETAAERELRLQLERERAERDEQIRSLTSAARNDQERTEAAIANLERQILALQGSLESQERAADAAQLEAEAEAQAERARLLREFEAQRDELIANYEERLAAATAVDPREQDRLAREAEQRRLEEERRARLEQIRAEQEALRQQRINSGLVALNNSGTEEGGDRQRRELSENAAFVQRLLEGVPTSTAEVFANPEATVVQGTIIQAALEVAIDSSLPGQIRAVVTEHVYSMDGSAVLIPAGSKVFGEYSDGIVTGQKRILIAWTRIVTPYNRSVNITSFGADRLGRSGTGGAVDTRFAARFGGAALISIIGAIPTIVAENATDDEDTQDVVEDVGSDFESATDSALNDVLSLTPVIYVRQGAEVSIIVDRDLEFN